MTNETKQAETSQHENWADGLFEPLDMASLANEPSPAYLDPDFEDAFADLDGPIKIESADDWFVSESSDLAQSMTADPTVLRTLLSELTEPHQVAQLAAETTDAVRSHGLEPVWIDYVNAHLA